MKNGFLFLVATFFLFFYFGLNLKSQNKQYFFSYFKDKTKKNTFKNSKYIHPDTGTYILHIIKRNYNCSDTQKFSIDVVLPTNVLELNNKQISENNYIEIYESSGKLIYKGVLESSIIITSDFDLKSSYYIICIKNAHTTKLIKQINIPR